jgi:hypothetical protein
MKYARDVSLGLGQRQPGADDGTRQDLRTLPELQLSTQVELAEIDSLELPPSVCGTTPTANFSIPTPTIGSLHSPLSLIFSFSSTPPHFRFRSA